MNEVIKLHKKKWSGCIRCGPNELIFSNYSEEQSL